MMKVSGLIAASVVAASAVSISSSSSSSSSSNYACNRCIHLSHQQGGVTQSKHEHPSSTKSAAAEKFTPRYDGLRFIETLVTAHR